MFEIEIILKKIYPQATSNQLAEDLILCRDTIIAFYPKSWLDVKKEDLANHDLQLRLVRTLYESQIPDESVIEMIMGSLEIWSGDTLIFLDLDDASRQFYLYFYALAGSLNFEWFGGRRQGFLLGTEFLVLMFVLDDKFPDRVANYFIHFCYLRLLKQSADDFRKAIEANPTLIGVSEDQHNLRSVAEWITGFDDYKSTSDDKLSDYLSNEPKFTELNQTYQRVLRQIILLREQLKSEDIIFSVNKASCVHITTKESVQSDISQQYLIRLSEVDDVSAWLEDYMDIAQWLKDKPITYIKQLFLVLQKKIDLSNEQQVNFLLLLINTLDDYGYPDAEKFLLFDETLQKFQWTLENVVK